VYVASSGDAFAANNLIFTDLVIRAAEELTLVSAGSTPGSIVFSEQILRKNLLQLGGGFMMIPLKGEVWEKVDNMGAFNVTSFGGKEGGNGKIEVNWKLKHVCVQWVKGVFKPRCLNASPPRPISTAALTTREIARKQEPTTLVGCAPAHRRWSKSSCGVSHHISNSTFE